MTFTRRPFAALNEGGIGSGNYGHAGRKGLVGGSAPGGDRSIVRAVFTGGGGASGKGLISKKYQARYGIDNVINSDDIKSKMPLYSYKSGQQPGASKTDPNPADDPTKYGPSGPRTDAAYAAYSPEDRQKMEDYIAQNTRFKNSDDFAAWLAQTYPDDVANGNKFGGGLTHEVSSYIAKQQLNDALANGDKSFIYDSTGSKAIADTYGPAALAQGMRVDVHMVSTDPEVAQMLNDARNRSVDPVLLYATHVKAAAAKPSIRTWAQAQRSNGAQVSYHDTRGNKPSDLRTALVRGYTKNSVPK